VEFVITNEKEFYYPEDKTNKICTTTRKKKAFIFPDKLLAENLVTKATNKLKGFRVEPLNPMDDQEEEMVAKVKRKFFRSEQREAVYNKYEGRCGICGKFVPYFTFIVDHIIPLSKSGVNSLDNLQCACQSCNAIKQDTLPEDLNDKLVEILINYMKQHPKDHVIWKQIKKAHKKAKKSKK